MKNYKKAIRVSLPDAKIELSIGDKFRHLEIESLECEVVSPYVINAKLTARQGGQVFIDELTHITHKGSFTVWWQKDTNCYQCDKEAFGICECGKPVCKLHSKVVKDVVYCKQCAKLSEEEEFQAYWEVVKKFTTLLEKKTPLATCAVCQEQMFIGRGKLYDKDRFTKQVDFQYVIGGTQYDEFDEMYGVLSIENQNRVSYEEQKLLEKTSKKRAWLFQISECPNGCKVCNKVECAPEIVEQNVGEKQKLVKYKCRVCGTTWEGKN